MNFVKLAGGRSKYIGKKYDIYGWPQEANSGATNDLGVNIVD
jgi:hypothetical protein